MSQTLDTLPLPRQAIRLGALFVAEIAVLVLFYQVLSDLECRATGIEAACRGLRWLVLWLVCAVSLLGVYLWARPAARAGFARGVTDAPGRGVWGVLHGLGVLVMLAPLILIRPEQINAQFHVVFPAMALGAVMAFGGGVLWLMRGAAWRLWLRGRGASIGAIAAAAALLPGLTVLAGPLWTVQAVTDVTFIAVFLLLSLFEAEVVVDPAAYVIGTPGFRVVVADSCSGIEGLVLITAFLALYAVLFRDDLRLRRVWLVIWPLALLASWLFNALRITTLVLIGAHGAPDLAVNGFHSFAGWLMFTGLSIAILVLVNRSGYALQDGPGVREAARLAPLAEDDLAGRILPFIVFALSGLIVQAFWGTPALGYPLQVAMMVGALWWVRRALWRYLVIPSGVAVLAGGAVGLGWILSAPPPEPVPEALLALGGMAFAVWAVLRILGTVMLVPVIEELFFRGYVQARLDRGTLPSRVLAIAVSATLFALVHGRWAEAGLAGIVFSLVYMRRSRVIDAITAHAVANAIISGVALWRGDWALI